MPMSRISKSSKVTWIYQLCNNNNNNNNNKIRLLKHDKTQANKFQK